jgi:uncharacterized protein YegL
MTEITIILDRSGSMQSIANDAIGGFNSFLKQQQAQPGSARLSLVLFDTQYEVIHKSVPLADVPPLTDQTFVPRGGTALLDAIGKTIHKMTNSFAARLPKARPENVIIAILTDGEENSSSDFTLSHINDLITAKKLQGWEFLFLAANQDAIATAGKMNISAKHAINFAATPEGTHVVMEEMSARISESRRAPKGPKE